MYDTYVDRPLVRILRPIGEQIDAMSSKAWPVGRLLLLAPMALAMKYHQYELAALLLVLLHVADRVHTSVRPGGVLAADFNMRDADMIATLGRMRFTLTVLAGKVVVILSLWTVLMVTNAPPAQSLVLWCTCLSLAVFECAHAVALVIEHVDIAASIRAGADDPEWSHRVQPAVETNARHAIELTGIAFVMLAHRHFSPLTSTVGSVGMVFLCVAIFMAARSLRLVAAKCLRAEIAYQEARRNAAVAHKTADLQGAASSSTFASGVRMPETIAPTR